jgi:K+-sensing histidine kinase KdpD
VVSHELRTPLTAIKGSAATVLGSRRPLEEAETREFFQIIDEQADRLRDLVDNLLDLTRIEAGSLSVATEPIELPEVLEEARAAFIRNGSLQEIHLEMPEGLPRINADRRRIAQVLVNLLSNAGKFPRQWPRLT